MDSKHSPARRAGLAAVMLAVLLASVGAAWLLTDAAARRVAAGAEILDEIRSAGLAKFWPEPLQEDWYLIRIQGKLVGWEAHVRGQSPQGNISMLMVKNLGHEIVEQTVVSPDLAWDRYWSHVNGDPFAEIELEGGKVAVAQHRLGLRAESPQPPNYIPEGLRRLVIRQVAEKGADAQFKTIADEEAIGAGGVRFLDERISYAGQGKDSGDRPVRLVASRSELAEPVTYAVDDSGRIVSVAAGDARSELSDGQTVVRHFRRAQEQVQWWWMRQSPTVRRSPALHGLEILGPQVLGALEQLVFRRFDLLLEREVDAPPVVVRPRR